MTGDADRDIGGPYLHPSHPDYAYQKWLWDQSHPKADGGIDPKILTGVLFLGFAYVTLSIVKGS